MPSCFRQLRKKKREKSLSWAVLYPGQSHVHFGLSQFHDIAGFCSDPSLHGLLKLDTTFHLGSFYVTPTSYRNLLLERTRTGKNPLFIRPILAHMTRSYAAYSQLLAELKEMEPDIDDVKVQLTPKIFFCLIKSP